MAMAADVRSKTGAMRDVFEAKRAVLEDYLKSFKLEGEQKGTIVFIGGEVAGLDFVSRESAYAMLHPKLIKSYAMEAMIAAELKKEGDEAEKEKGKPKGTKSSRKGGKEDRAGAGKPEAAKAREFLGKAADCIETRYPSVGLGASLRYEGRDVIGSALAVESRIIHMAFFRNSANPGGRAGDMAAFSSRRRFRTE